MRYRIRTSNGFLYVSTALANSTFNYYDLYVGCYNEIELYAGDILKINHQYYLVRSSLTLLRETSKQFVLFAIDLSINRKPTIPDSINLNFKSSLLDIFIIPSDFKLIGNIHQLENLKL